MKVVTDSYVLVRCCLSVVLYLCCVDSFVCANDALFSKDGYRFQVKKIENVYDNMSMEVLKEVYRPPQEGFFPSPNGEGFGLTLDYRQKYKVYILENSHFRVDSTLYDSKGVIIRDDVFIVDPKESFNFRRLPEKSFFLAGRTNTTDSLLSKKDDLLFLNASWSFLGKSIFFRLFEREGIKSTEVTTGRDADNGSLVVVRQTVEIESGRGDFTYSFLNDKEWVVKDASAVSRTKQNNGEIYNQVVSQICEYGGEQNGVPIIEKIYLEHSLGVGEESPQIIERTVYTISKVQFSPPSLDVFDVSPFLSGKIGQSVEFSLFRVFLILLGIVMIILAIYLRRKNVA